MTDKDPYLWNLIDQGSLCWILLDRRKKTIRGKKRSSCSCSARTLHHSFGNVPGTPKCPSNKNPLCRGLCRMKLFSLAKTLTIQLKSHSRGKIFYSLRRCET